MAGIFLVIMGNKKHVLVHGN